MNKKLNLDVVDLIVEMKKVYPHVEMEIVEVEKAMGRDYYLFHKFRLKRLLNINFEPTIKTSISFVKNDEITIEEFFHILQKMEESFSMKKLLGV